MTMKSPALIILIGFILSGFSRAQQVPLSNLDVNNLILQMRGEIVSALDITESMLSAKGWLSSGMQIGFIEKMDALPPLQTSNRVNSNGTRVSMHIISPPGKIGDTHQFVDVQESFRLPRDWKDSANERGNLTSVRDDPLTIDRAFAFEIDGSKDSFGKMIPLPKVWAEEFFHATQTSFELKELLRKPSLTQADVAKLVSLHDNSPEPVRCVLFAKLVLGNAWGGAEISKNILDSKSLYEAAVKTLFCLNNKGDFSLPVDNLGEHSKLKSEVVRGMAFGCYLNLKTKRLDLLPDLKTYRNLVPFRNPNDKILLESLKERLLKEVPIKLLSGMLRFANNEEDAEVINALLKASNIASELKQ